MHYPINSDERYSIEREWTGKDKPQYVLRFCHGWIDSKPTLKGAISSAMHYRQSRLYLANN